VLLAAIDAGMVRPPGFDHVEVMKGAHRHKLDALGCRVVRDLSEDDGDILIFLDGDAFPIRPLTPFIGSLLGEAPLGAICRIENEEDYPHPSFCATTAGFWRDLGGTWEISSDPSAPTNELGGGRLRDLLREHGVDWRRLLRTNAFNPHPVMFGLYAGVIYHHGAGFRRPITAADRKPWEQPMRDGWLDPRGERLCSGVVADKNSAMSTTFKQLIEHVPAFHEILELPYRSS
jgi:hypothetical protein